MPSWPGRTIRRWSNAAKLPQRRRTWKSTRPARISRLDPASLPEAPAEPNRLAIAGVGTLLGLVAGIMLAGGREVKNTTLKNLKDIRAYTNLPVLSSIPLLENALLVRKKRRLFWLAWSSAIIIGSIAMSSSAYYYYFGHN